jgi:hypothetical protein
MCRGTHISYITLPCNALGWGIAKNTGGEPIASKNQEIIREITNDRFNRYTLK